CSFLRLFLQGRCGATRALAGTRVGAGALAAHRQAALVAHATVRAQVDQTLDRQLHFAAQVAFDRVAVDLFTDLFQFLVGQILDLLRVLDAGRFADLAGAGAADAEDGRQTDLGVLVRRNIDASNTGHDCSSRHPLCPALALALFMTRFGADDAPRAVTFDDFAVAADPLYRCHYLHGDLLVLDRPLPTWSGKQSWRATDHRA